MNLEKPTYTTVQPEGLLPVFISSLVFNGVTYTGNAGRNKKEAEQLAARSVILSILGNNIYMLEIVPDSLQDVYKICVCVRVGGWVGMHSCVCLSAHLYEYPCTFFLFALMYLYVCFFAVVFGFVYANSVSKCRQHLRLSLHIQHVCLHMHLMCVPCMHMLVLAIDFVFAHHAPKCASLHVCTCCIFGRTPLQPACVYVYEFPYCLMCA